MIPKVKKEAPAPPKTNNKAKVLRAKNAVLKSVHIHKKDDPYITYLPLTQDAMSPQRQPRYSQKSIPNRNKLDHYGIIKFHLTNESAMKEIEDDNTLGFIVDEKPRSATANRL
ncbi:large ribosomal subunit protein uL23-like [Dasypus novemcinctus]|uniref:large ribosomal subunit protein uL23-like n=1 Tax=Dasypus novemcinctus TaxID=9361 RepID=UPI00265E61C1|nr:large ribosomal subunit protein uL23-like [Dasypus novemcinctus]